MVRISIFIALLISLFACQTNSKKDSEISWQVIELDQAKYFRLFENDSMLKVVVLSAIDSNESSKELFSHEFLKGKALGSSVITASAHLGAFAILNQQEELVGVSRKMYMYDSLTRKLIDDQKIREVGGVSGLNKELIISLGSQNLFYSAQVGDDHNLEWVENLGMQLIPTLEWREERALGRAEWIKFYGALFNKLDESVAFYNTVKKNYDSQLNQNSDCPKVLVGSEFQGTWYTPAGESFLAKLLKESGGCYYWESTTGNGSLNKAFEVILENQKEDEIWINPGFVDSMDDLMKKNSKYELFDAVQSGSVFIHNKKMRDDGSNDFWEQGVYRPDLLKSDFIELFSDSINTDNLNYYIRLK